MPVENMLTINISAILDQYEYKYANCSKQQSNTLTKLNEIETNFNISKVNNSTLEGNNDMLKSHINYLKSQIFEKDNLKIDMVITIRFNGEIFKNEIKSFVFWSLFLNR